MFVFLIYLIFGQSEIYLYIFCVMSIWKESFEKTGWISQEIRVWSDEGNAHEKCPDIKRRVWEANTEQGKQFKSIIVM